MNRIDRIFLSLVHDGLMAMAAPILALYLRVGSSFSDYAPDMVLANAGLFAVVTLVLLRIGGLYRGIWRYASINDLYAICRAATIAVLVFTLLSFQLTRLEGEPRSTLVIQWLLLIALLSGPRIAYRLFKDRRLDRVFERDVHQRVPVILVGASDGAELFIREARRDRSVTYDPVGIVGLTDSRVGRAIHGVPVLGTIDTLAAVVDRLSARDRCPQRLIVTQDDIPGARLRSLLEAASALGLAVGRMPRITELKAGVTDQLAVRPIAVEDLLFRPQRVLDRAAMATLIAGRRVLVTGAGGTIGSELVRQIAALAPGHLALVDNAEYQLYLIDLALEESWRDLPRTAHLADVRDRRRIDEIMTEIRPELVFHAAALKHVPMVEANPLEGVLTNVIGTRNVAEASRASQVTAMVMISTDKAVDPANVMGATKRVAESLCQSLDLLGKGDEGRTRFITVRFGNVLGSTGSVVPLFQRQLASGGPLTVTHPDVERYFMTVREAVELVLQAATGTRGGEPGGIYVLEMGEPVRIAELARQMIRLAGLTPDQDVQVEFVGLRPGEKLNEVLFHAAEALVPTGWDGIRLARPRATDFAVLARTLDELEDAARARHPDRALAILQRLVPEFRAPPALIPLPKASGAA